MRQLNINATNTNEISEDKFNQLIEKGIIEVVDNDMFKNDLKKGHLNVFDNDSALKEFSKGVDKMVVLKMDGNNEFYKEEVFYKAKYTKRTGSKGNYKYEYGDGDTSKQSKLPKDIANAKKKYNSESRQWQYLAPSGIVLMTTKTEKSLENNWNKYLKIWD